MTKVKRSRGFFDHEESTEVSTSAGIQTPRSGSSRVFLHSEESTAASTSTGIPTPRSSIVPSSSSAPEYTPSHDHDSNAHSEDTPHDRVLPSIEQDFDGTVTDDSSTSTNTRALTPSLSLTPPPNSGYQADGPSYMSPRRQPAARGSDDIGNMNAQLENMRLSNPRSSMGMAEIANAIDNVARGHDSRANSLLEPRSSDSKSPSPGRRSPHRRRSSSRANMEIYNVCDEEPPNDRFHDPTFQRAFGDAKKLMQDLADTLGSSALHIDPDSTMRRLHRQAKELARFQCPSSRTVGFVGESGVGKSSLLNSLLDYRSLARTSNSGAACTCVATEYHYHNSTEFIVEVDVFTKDEIADQLEDLVQSYQHFHLSGEDLDDDEREDFKKKAEVAIDTFRAMFRDRLADEDFLIDCPEEEVINTLISWVDDAAPLTMIKRQVTSNLDDCSALLMRHTSEHISPEGPAVWPYIKKIRVYLKAHILSKGLVLVDLPGLRDLNSARRHITERYLLKCDEIFVICNIGRAITDVGVMSVFELAEKAALTNVGIICTKSDEIIPEEAKKDWKGQKARNIQGRIDNVERERREVENIRSELADYDDTEDDLSDGERNEQNELNRRLRRAEDRLNDHDFELKRYVVTNRNESVQSELVKLYSDRVLPHGKLNVFCVGNHGYWSHREKSVTKALRHLNLSGIITVRKHCMAMVSESQLFIATKYIRDDISALLGDVELWVQSGSGSMSAERKKNVRETLDALEARLKRDLRGNASEISTIGASFRTQFQDEITDLSRRKTTAWSESAEDASYDWSSWHHATYAAFCRNYGDHSTAAVGSRNWNEEVIKSMARDLKRPWRELCTSFDEHNDRITNLIHGLMDWAVQYLDTELQETSDSTAVLSETLMSRQRLLEGELEAAWNEFEANLATLRTDAFSGIRSSFIGNAMERSYRNACCESGRGSDARRKAIINDTVRRAGLFNGLMKEFKAEFRTLTDTLQQAVQSVVASHLDHIRATLDMIRSDNIALESEMDPEFRTRVEAGVLAAKGEMRRVQSVLGP